MKVFADYHHGNLYASLHYLFEKRLGFELYRPIGIDWVVNGYWKVAEPYGNAKDTVDQFLGINDRTWDAFEALNGDYRLADDIYHIYDKENSFEHKAITFEKFREMEFDLIIATHPLHNNWEELLKYQPKAKFIVQIGNEGQTTDTKNVLCSTSDFQPKDNQNYIKYHQEFDIKDFYYVEPKNHNTIKSFVISLPEPETYQMYKEALPEFEFKAYGVGSPDGTVHGGDIAQMMKESAFGYHIKPLDGFGHVIHKWAFSGRPLITKGSYYKGKIAEPLLIDGVTCVDLDKHTVAENIELIKESSKPENHIKMCQVMYDIAKRVCNFEAEAVEIKNWINYLIQG